MHAKRHHRISLVKRVMRISRLGLLLVTASIVAFVIGFYGQWDNGAVNLYWEWEKLQAVSRDMIFRRSETLPPPVSGIHSANEKLTEVSVEASYEQRVLIAEDLPVVMTSTDKETSMSVRPIAVPRQQLTGFEHEYQQPNNCGPATLAIAMRYWGWKGTQATIAEVLKPQLRDKNVRWDELVYYVRTHAGWLDALFRVGGDVDTLEHFVGNGFPVIIETGYELDTGWVGHYLVVSGYDSHSRVFTIQDVTGGPNRDVSYEEISALWNQFNGLYILVFPIEKRAEVLGLLGDDENLDDNRYSALLRARADIEAEPENAFAWFAYGSNMNYFDRYSEAAAAFDQAREIGLPWRMLFYQFGPYVAYFNVGRYQDVVDLATVTLRARPVLEESYVWRGWALYMLGDTDGARGDFRSALGVNPNFIDAITALDVVGE